jgi:hypothetical protein
MSSKEHHLGQHREHRTADVRPEESRATLQLRHQEVAARKQAVHAGQDA